MLTLHFAPNSRAGRIYWLLKELDLPFDRDRVLCDFLRERERLACYRGEPFLEGLETLIAVGGVVHRSTAYVLAENEPRAHQGSDGLQKRLESSTKELGRET